VSMTVNYIAYNAAVPTTAAMSPVATGTSIKTLLQLTAPSTRQLLILEWGISFDGNPSAIKTELINTTTVAGGTPTAVTPSVLTPGGPPSLATAGFSPSSEGSVVATCRVFDNPVLSANTYVKQWPLGYEPVVDVSQVVRIRVTAAVTVNALCYIAWREG